jgi:predicted PurR-regulated permease PerM
MFMGRVAVRMMLFPYGSRFLYRMLDSQLNENFGREFHQILERTYNTINKQMRGEIILNEKDMDQARFSIN